MVVARHVGLVYGVESVLLTGIKCLLAGIGCGMKVLDKVMCGDDL